MRRAKRRGLALSPGNRTPHWPAPYTTPIPRTPRIPMHQADPQADQVGLDHILEWSARGFSNTRPHMDAPVFDAMNSLDQVLLEKIKQLPPQRMAEVEDFVDFLRAREGEKRLTLTAAKASEASFAQVWDNDEDAAYDRI